MAERFDALFLSYYEDVDKWHNDHLNGESATAATGIAPGANPGRDDLTTAARTLRQSVRIDGGFYDFPRFLSWVRYGTTAEYRRYDSFAATHLSGSYFRSMLGRRGFDVRHVNTSDRVTIARLAGELDPRWVLVSTSFLSETARIADVCHRVRQAWPDAGLVLGGLVLVELERSLHPIAFRHMLSAWGADAYVVSPQGEHALIEILSHEPADLARLDLPRTWVRGADGWEMRSSTPERPFPLDDEYVRWSELDPGTLYHAVNARTARSCAFQCSFCTFPALQGGLELADPETLRRELDELARGGTVKSLLFTDDTFNVPPKRFVDLCRVLEGHSFEWYSFFRPQFADEETAQRMADSGCRAVFLGIESLSDEMLRRMKKTATREAVERGIRLLKRHGIVCHVNFIIGFPGDVPANTEAIPPFLDDLGVDFYCLSPWYHSPTAPIAAEREAYGIEGRFWRWKHDTMDVERAIELEKWVLDQPSHGVFMSEIAQNTFWGEIQLFVNGFSVDDARRVVRAYDELSGRDTPSEALRGTPLFREVRKILEAHPMPLPPGAVPGAAAGAREAR